MEIRRQLYSPGEVACALQTDPEGLGAGRVVARAAQEATEASNPAEHGGQRRWRDRRGPPLNRDVNGLPFSRVQDRITRQVGGNWGPES